MSSLLSVAQTATLLPLTFTLAGAASVQTLYTAVKQ